MKINDQAREELLTEISGISDENLNKKPSSEQWSIKEIVEHLYLLESNVAMMIKQNAEKGENATVSHKPIEATVNRDVKVNAPATALPSDKFASINELEEKLSTSHQQLEELEKAVDVQLLKQKAFPHPAFGLMSLDQWIPFVGYHEKRHILQIQEVKQQLGL
ncbi:DinB family protein [Rummeliibacillus sp. BSL5]